MGKKFKDISVLKTTTKFVTLKSGLSETVENVYSFYHFFLKNKTKDTIYINNCDSLKYINYRDEIRYEQ